MDYGVVSGDKSRKTASKIEEKLSEHFLQRVEQSQSPIGKVSANSVELLEEQLQHLELQEKQMRLRIAVEEKRSAVRQ